MSSAIRVLFLCTGNSCRSQMAEGLLRSRGGGRFEASSAGTSPKTVHSLALRAMAELGIDVSSQVSESVDRYIDANFDWVITVCDNAKQSCPTFSGAARRLHWSFDDPAEAAGLEERRMEVFRGIRDEIDERIREFVAEPSNQKGKG